MHAFTRCWLDVGKAPRQKPLTSSMGLHLLQADFPLLSWTDLLELHTQVQNYSNLQIRQIWQEEISPGLLWAGLLYAAQWPDRILKKPSETVASSPGSEEIGIFVGEIFNRLLFPVLEWSAQAATPSEVWSVLRAFYSAQTLEIEKSPLYEHVYEIMQADELDENKVEEEPKEKEKEKESQKDKGFVETDLERALGFMRRM